MAVVSYDLGWDTNCIGWSSVPAPTQRIALSSFITDGPNQVCLLEKNPNTEQLELVSWSRLNYPATKVAFAPPSAIAGGDKDILVTSSDFLRLWHVTDAPVPPPSGSNTVGDHVDTRESATENTMANSNNAAGGDNNANAGGDNANTNTTTTTTAAAAAASTTTSSSASEIPARFKAPALSQWRRLNLDLKHSFKPSRNGSAGASAVAAPQIGGVSGTSAASTTRHYNPVTHPHLSDDFSEPVTSFDWNVDKPNMVAATSTDTTICVWDILQQQLLVQLIAHDRPVYDCSFAPGESVFASCGADGSVRVFDLRAMDNCTIVYEEGPAHPMLRVAWSHHSPYIAVTIAESPRVVIVDMRNPTRPVCLHANHNAPVNAITWAPHYGHALCCVSEDQRAMIWDINAEPLSPPMPQMTYEAEAPINGVSWYKSHEEWVAIAFGTKCSLLLV